MVVGTATTMAPVQVRRRRAARTYKAGSKRTATSVLFCSCSRLQKGHGTREAGHGASLEYCTVGMVWEASNGQKWLAGMYNHQKSVCISLQARTRTPAGIPWSLNSESL